ncbi:hypothetical protein MKW94_023396 [Papaver nudicaule]|uniref:SAM domain-containing protein n=1 Tax=Papaver nudicaule TaxID=74823 RepID=A0AA41VKT9_PAPNU|nr:hypothetical protein [Papaver nudicaule]
MEGGGSVTLPLQKKNNNLNFKSVCSQLQTKWGELEKGWEELEKGFHGWVSKQPWVVQAAAFTAPYLVQGVAAGLIYGSLAQSELANCFFPFQYFGSTRLLQVRNFSILRGTDGAMVCTLKKLRGGRDDTPARALAAFTSGYLFQMFTKTPPCGGPDAIMAGLILAVCHGLLYQVEQGSSQPPVKDTCFTRTRCMLLNLGFQNYENNFKKNLLTDDVLPLLNKSDLEEAGIPLGPTLQILNHIKREPDLLKKRES